MKLPVLLAGLVLAGPAARAQAPAAPAPERPASFAVEYDSLQQRAARVRRRTEARTGEFRSSFMALGGTSRRIESFALAVRGNSASDNSVSYRLVKKEVTKHKTHGADVTKIFYYDPSGRLLLAELYQQQQLVRQELREYALRAGRATGVPFRTTEWLRGDYLRLVVREDATSLRPRRYYLTAQRPPQ